MESTSTPTSDVVTVNVGGKIFLTTMATLNASGENFLTQMINLDRNSVILCNKDREGNYFVDRSPKLFESILEYLRCGDLQPPIGVSKARLQRELDFYSIKAPEGFAIEPPSAPSGQELQIKFRDIENVAREVILQIWPEFLAAITTHARYEYDSIFRIRTFVTHTPEPSKCRFERSGGHYYNGEYNLCVSSEHPQVGTINSIMFFPIMASLLKREMGIYASGHKFYMDIRVNDTTMPSVVLPRNQ